MKKLRLAFGRINQETNALSPVSTELSDFQATHLLRGGELLEVCGPGRTEVQGMFKNAELSGFVQGARRVGKKRSLELELVPLISAWAVPSGPLSRACFEGLVDELCERLRAAGPVDGVYLSLHGAMGVRDLALPIEASPDSEILRRVRAVVGAEVPIAVSLDLHGNLTRAMVEGAELIQAYRTNPHRDHRNVGAGLAERLVQVVLQEVKPVKAWRSLPMLLGGGTTVDFLSPMRRIFRQAKAIEAEPGVLGASLMMVHPWNNHLELGWSTLVIVDEQKVGRDQAEAHAEALAESAWSVRDQMPPTFQAPEAAIARARAATLARKLGVVVMADFSDVVTAGAPGENTALIRAFLEHGQDLLAYVPLRDPALVAALWDQPLNREVEVELGRKLDPARGQGLHLKATLADRRTTHGVGRALILRAGQLVVVVTEGPAMAVKPSFYSDLGLSVWKADVVVVKNFFPFLLYFLPYARKNLFVKTAGITDFDAAYTLPFAGPIHPRDVVPDWRPADRRRRIA